MCGYKPLADAVTRSIGIRACSDGSADRSASTRLLTASANSGLSGPRFEPLEEAALYGKGLVAEGRPHKSFGSSYGCPISRPPIARPSLTIKLPFAALGKSIHANPVTASG